MFRYSCWVTLRLTLRLWKVFLVARIRELSSLFSFSENCKHRIDTSAQQNSQFIYFMARCIYTKSAIHLPPSVSDSILSSFQSHYKHNNSLQLICAHSHTFIRSYLNRAQKLHFILAINRIGSIGEQALCTHNK